MVVSRGQAAKAAVTRVFALGHQTKLQIKVGDLTKSAVGAIVNAANERMLGGGGVDGAIHRAAGPRLYEACKAVPEVMPGVRCPTGEARITPGFDLPASYVVHTVGPIYENDFESAPLLRASHWSSLEVAAREGVASVAFPAISCGVYGYPVGKAARIAVQTCLEFSLEKGPTSPLTNIEFVLFSQDIFTAWVSAAEELTTPPGPEPEPAPPATAMEEEPAQPPAAPPAGAPQAAAAAPTAEAGATAAEAAAAAPPSIPLHEATKPAAALGIEASTEESAAAAVAAEEGRGGGAGAGGPGAGAGAGAGGGKGKRERKAAAARAAEAADEEEEEEDRRAERGSRKRCFGSCSATDAEEDGQHDEGGKGGGKEEEEEEEGLTTMTTTTTSRGSSKRPAINTKKKKKKGKT